MVDELRDTAREMTVIRPTIHISFVLKSSNGTLDVYVFENDGEIRRYDDWNVDMSQVRIVS